MEEGASRLHGASADVPEFRPIAFRRKHWQENCAGLAMTILADIRRMTVGLMEN
jgi:hypothetical protein